MPAASRAQEITRKRCSRTAPPNRTVTSVRGPDHGRHLWDEKPGNVRPGYGLYDRALGIMYMLGVWDMLEKLDVK